MAEGPAWGAGEGGPYVGGSKATVRRFFEGHTSLQNAENVADELLAPGFVTHVPPFPDVRGAGAYKEFIAGTFAAYPDARFDIEDILGAEGGRVVVRWTLRGTHEGTTRTGVAPTGRKVSAAGITIVRFGDGGMAEAWMNVDFLGLMQQIGAFSWPGQQLTDTLSSGQGQTH